MWRLRKKREERTMQKLIIADDERVILETISRLIDWESLGIELTGL